MKKPWVYAGFFAGGMALFMFLTLAAFWQIIHPQKIFTGLHPGMFKLPAEEMIFVSRDGLQLSAWFIESPAQKEAEDKSAVIILHGYPSEKNDMLFIAKDLYPTFSVLLMDMRYFGKSEGAYSTLGIQERYDVSTATDFLQAKGYQNIGIFGYSLGGSVALLSADTDNRITAVASYAAFANYQTIAEDIYQHLGPVKYIISPALLFWGQWFFGESLTSTTPELAAESLKIPVLLIHNKEDDQIPFRQAEILQKALQKNDRAKFSFSEKGKHNDLPEDFNAQLKKFFEENLGGAVKST